jgi:hypothetical protein
MNEKNIALFECKICGFTEKIQDGNVSGWAIVTVGHVEITRSGVPEIIEHESYYCPKCVGKK